MDSIKFRFEPDLIPSFLAVAETGKISRAANRLNISQPALTAQIKKLEASLGVQLFERSVKGASLTTVGQKFLDRATSILNLVNETGKELDESHSTRGELKIAASTTIADYVLPPLLAKFKKRHPQVQINLIVKNTEEVIRLSREQKISLGLVEGLSKAPSVKLEHFINDKLILTAPPAWAISIKQIKDIFQYPLIMREMGSGTRAIIERFLKRSGIQLKNFNEIIEVGSSTAIKSAVATELGIAFLSYTTIKNEIALQKLIPIVLPNLSINRDFSWVTSSGALSEPANVFKQFCTGIKKFDDTN